MKNPLDFSSLDLSPQTRELEDFSRSRVHDFNSSVFRLTELARNATQECIAHLTKAAQAPLSPTEWLQALQGQLQPCSAYLEKATFLCAEYAQRNLLAAQDFSTKSLQQLEENTPLGKQTFGVAATLAQSANEFMARMAKGLASGYGPLAAAK
jgi:hypothetical protein